MGRDFFAPFVWAFLKKSNPRPNHKAEAVKFHTDVYTLVMQLTMLQETDTVGCNLEHFC